MKAILFLGLLSVVLSSSVYTIETLATFKDVEDFFDNVEGSLNFFSGIGNGIVQTAKNDIKAFPECIYGFPCAYGVIVELIEYLKSIKKFDIIDFINKLKALLFQGLVGCLQPCMIPVAYISHFYPLFERGPILERLQNFFIQGLIVSIPEIILGLQTIISSIITKNYYECGYTIGVIIWCIVIR